MEKIVKLIVDSSKISGRFDRIMDSQIYKILMEIDEVELGDLYLYFKELYFSKIETIIPQDKYFKFDIDPGRFSLDEAYLEIFQNAISLLQKQINVKEYTFHGGLDYGDDPYRKISFLLENQEFITTIEHSNYVDIKPVLTTLHKIKRLFDENSNYFFIQVQQGGIAYVNQKEFLTLISQRHIFIEDLGLE
jgi:hypothetical protein